MSKSKRPFSANILLRALSDDDFALLEPHFTRVVLDLKTVLVPPYQAVEHVFFLEDGVGSIVADMTTGRTEVGIFGRDGVSASFLILGSDRSPHETFMQVAGFGLRIDTDVYLAAIRQSDTLRAMLLRYVHTFVVQTSQNTAANAHVRVDARLARWLLMTHDRVDGDEIVLTHEILGIMIAADRSTVTVSLHVLEGAGVIRSKRGRVIILDREKLEALAGDAYGVPEAEYRHLIGPFGRSQGASIKA